MDWTGIGGIIAAVAVGAWRGIDKYREYKKTKLAGLDSNPDRCEKHEIRLAVIEQRLEQIESDLREIKARMK
jgi:hypothetical protein